MSEETETNKTESAETPAKKAAPRKRTAAPKAAAAKTGAKKAASANPAAKKAATPKKAPEPTPPPIPEMAAADLDEQEETVAGQENAAREDTATDKEDFMAELKEKDWAGYLVRGVFMLLFGFLSWLAISVCFLMAGIQFIVLILTGGPNDAITRVIMTAGNYIADVMAYLSFKTDERPFPLGKPLPAED